MHLLAGNARYAVRLLWKTPAFTATAVCCLGLAIGANTALFGIFNTLLWKPLPARDPQALVRLFTKPPAETRMLHGFSFHEYEEYRVQDGVLAGLAATRGVQAVFRAEGTDTRRVFGEAVSDGYFDVLGVRARMGRTLAAGRDGGANVATEVVLSDRFWKQRLNAAPDVIGRTIWLTGIAYTVVGVAPPGFTGTYPSPIFAAELWLPLATLRQIDPAGERMFRDRAERSLGLIGRLRPGVGIAGARAAMDTVARRLQRSWPESNTGITVLVFRELDTHPEVYSSRALNLVAMLFLGLAGLVLLVACANLANLMLARAAARRKEIAVRLALGATRAQLVQQLVIESLALALMAGGVGLFIGWAASRAISSVRLPTDLPIVFDVAMDVRVACFTLAISIAAALAFGLLPALGASRPDLVPALKAGDRPQSGRRRRLTLDNALVVSQVALSLVLLAAAGLFWRSVAGAGAIDPGLQLARRTLVSFNPSLLRYDSARTAVFYRDLLQRVRQSPEIERAALVGWVPLGFEFQEGTFQVRGAGQDDGQSGMPSLVNVASPEFAETLGVPVRAGRTFTEQDTAETTPVAVVNETFARRAWAGADPVGRQVRAAAPDAPWLTVVGVVADGKYRTLTEGPRPLLLRPIAQRPSTALTLVATARREHASALAAIRRDVQALDPGMPLLDAKTMEQQMAKVRFLPQAMTALAAPAATIAVLIAAVGLYGVIACSVGRRTREFGIRRAIGAQRRDLAGEVMSQGLSVVGVGVGLGLFAALGVSRMMRRLLVGVSAADPAVFLASVGLLVALGALATYLPARRASRIDPLVALRHE